MRNRSLEFFSTVKTEGAMLPPEILIRIAEMDGEMGGVTPDAYHLDKGEKVNEAINRSWNRLLGVWATFRKAKEALPQEDPGTSLTREKWLLKLFDELGYGRLLPSKPTDVEGKIYPISHFWQHTPIHLVGFRADLDKSLTHHTGAYRYKPHSMVQEFLNRTEGHLWAFLSNGLRLRILRDNTSLVRQAYVEFDLEAMMEGGIFPDFKLLWLLCHQSRVEADRPEDCWLENWTRVTQVVGTRAREDLRKGVQRAIEALGSGFLSHPANELLREDLRAGRLDKQDYYRELLRCVYQLIFLFVAEDRDLLSPPSTTPEAKNRYIRYYSTARLRLLAGRKAGTRHDDLYRVTRLVIDSLGEGEGRKEVGIPILNSSLFSSSATPSLRKSLIANMDYLEAIRALAITSDRHGRRPTDFRNLGSEELGSVYESLLELHPDVNIEAKTFSLKAAAGNERRTTGSYYTPTSLITCLLDTALDPVLDDAEAKENPEQAILDLKVCDPACGSGHFLIAAAHRMAGRLASIRAGEEEPPPDIYRRALRDVIGHCIYGVDLNPMAVELCKVSIWMEALEPGKPLSFLDHHIRVGNSLLGTNATLIVQGIPDDAFAAIEGDDKKACSALKKRNKAERSGLGPLFAQQDARAQIRLQQAAAALEEMPDDDLVHIRQKADAFARVEADIDYRNKKLLADAWCAAFVIRKTFKPGTTETVSLTQRHINDLAQGQPLSGELAAEVGHAIDCYRFFHWTLAFPEAFARGGFDVILSNPPWELTQFNEKEWFAELRPEIANARTGSERKGMIEALRTEDPILHIRYIEALREHDGVSHFLGNSKMYPLCGRGRINLYAVFAELMRNCINENGRVGAVLPTGIATDDTTKFFFQDVVQKQSLVNLFDFENKLLIFPDVASPQKFCLFTVGSGKKPIADRAEFVFFAHSVDDLRDAERRFTLTPEEITRLNPNTRTSPIFRSRHDAELTKSIYVRVPVFVYEGSSEGNPWGITFKQGLFNQTSDSNYFRTKEQLEAEGWRLDKNIFRCSDEDLLPLYEAKLFHHYDHRYNTYEGVPEKSRFNVKAFALPMDERKNDPYSVTLPRFWVPASEVNIRWPRRYGWTFVFRDITNVNTNRRTAIFSLIPKSGIGNSAPLLMVGDAIQRDAPCLYATLTSFIFDYVARQSVGGTHLNFFILKQLPVLIPTTFSKGCLWIGRTKPLREWVLARVLELTYTAWDLEPFAQDCGWSGPPFRWDEDRRFLLRCELDAAFFHLYLLSEANGDWHPAEGEAAEDLARLKASFPTPCHAVAYIMDTFPIVKRKDEEKYGTYRTKDTILEIYIAMAEALRTGQPYQTRLDPPPADPRCCHPPRNA